MEEGSVKETVDVVLISVCVNFVVGESVSEEYIGEYFVEVVYVVVVLESKVFEECIVDESVVEAIMEELVTNEEYVEGLILIDQVETVLFDGSSEDDEKRLILNGVEPLFNIEAFVGDDEKPRLLKDLFPTVLIGFRVVGDNEEHPVFTECSCS